MAKIKHSKGAHKPEVEIEGFFYERLSDGRLLIEGHRFNAEQERYFRKKVAERLGIAGRPNSGIADPLGHAHDVGLSDALYQYQPRPQARRRLLHLSHRVSDAMRAVASLRDADFTDDALGDEVCKLAQRLVAEGERRLGRLRMYVDSMAAQSTTKLHHWTATEDKIKRSAEMANG